MHGFPQIETYCPGCATQPNQKSAWSFVNG